MNLNHWWNEVLCVREHILLACEGATPAQRDSLNRALHVLERMQRGLEWEATIHNVALVDLPPADTDRS